ncbi:hypothetical protein Tco_1087270 [Tanacetum coccineum]
MEVRMVRHAEDPRRTNQVTIHGDWRILGDACQFPLSKMIRFRYMSDDVDLDVKEVIAKHNASGNCLRFNLNGMLVSEGLSTIRGIAQMSPILPPDIIFASIIFIPILSICSLVPLHNPALWSMFLILRSLI